MRRDPMHTPRPPSKPSRRPPSVRALRERWAALLHDAPDVVALTEGFTRSPFPAVDGRLDFRGLPVAPHRPHAVAEPHVVLGGVRDADFSHSVWRASFWHGGAFIGCLFNGAQLGSPAEGSPSFMAVAWLRCRFDAAKLYDATFAHGTGMADCHFEGTELRGTSFRCLSLLRCRFIGCRFACAGRHTGPSISDCRLRDCVFEGDELRALSLRNVALHGGAFRGALHDVSINPWGDAMYTRHVARDDGGPGQWLPTPFEQVPMQLRGVDFSQARLVAVQWNGYPYLHECLLPPPQTHCIYANDEAVYQALLRAAAQQLQGEERAIVTERIAFWLRPHGSVPHQVVCLDWELQNGLGTEHGEALARTFFDLISRTVDALGVRVTGRGPVDDGERGTWPALPTLITPRSHNPANAGRRAPLPPRPAADPALRERWIPLLGEYGNALALTDNFTRSPFGHVDGRLDLRGLPVCFGVDPATHEQPALTAPAVTDVDFSGSHWLPAHWQGGAFTRCLFQEAQYEYGTTFWATRLAQCRFVGGLLDRAGFQAAVMHDCRFEDTAFNRVHFKDSRLVRCRFERVSCVRWLQFGGCELQDCAFDPEPAGLSITDIQGVARQAGGL